MADPEQMLLEERGWGWGAQHLPGLGVGGEEVGGEGSLSLACILDYPLQLPHRQAAVLVLSPVLSGFMGHAGPGVCVVAPFLVCDWQGHLVWLGLPHSMAVLF